MDTLMIFLLSISAGYIAHVAISHTDKIKWDDEIRDKLLSIKQREYALHEKETAFTERLAEYDKKENILAQNNQILVAKIKDIPTLAKIYSDIQFITDEKIPTYLEQKTHSAPKAAEIVRLSNKNRQVLSLRLKALEYKCWLYESMVPYLSELDEEDSIAELDNIVENRVFHDSDEADRKWLSPKEYLTLSSTQKFQLALDRWWNRPRTKSEIGADYERYIGYKFEQSGWHIIYNGIEKGLKDMGIDLIGQKDGNYITVQCKNWSSHKTIHEKHINQLFGTTVDFYLNRIDPEGSFSKFYSLIQEKRLRMFFITSTELSETARRVADTLGVLYVENEKFQPYPIIKCNINSKKEKIYHLPYDQQYDRTEIRTSGEFYAMTVAEAEAAGFRRAKKHFYS